MHLAELQQALQEYMLNPEMEAKSCFVNLRGAELAQGLNIYRDGYYLRLVGALKSDYEILQTYLGVPQFNQLIVAYLHHHPSRFFSLREVGANLSQFIHAQYPEKLLWAELAEFEWKLKTVLFNEEASPFSIEDLKSISSELWSELIFKCHPSVQLFKAHYPLGEVWHALNNALPIKPEFTQPSAEHDYLIWCKQYQSYFRVLHADEKQLFDMLARQLSFAELCEHLSHCIPEEKVVASLSRTLHQWIAEGLIVL